MSAEQRKQDNADGFQAGWHAALKRLTEGDSIAELRQLVPECPPLWAVEDNARLRDGLAALEQVTRNGAHSACESYDGSDGPACRTCGWTLPAHIHRAVADNLAALREGR